MYKRPSLPYKDPEVRKAYDRMRSRLPHRIMYKRERSRLPHSIATRKRHGNREFNFLGKWTYISWLPLLTHRCSRCQKENTRTDRHHSLGYFPIFKWFGIEELCDGCHNIVRAQPRDLVTGRFILSH